MTMPAVAAPPQTFVLELDPDQLQAAFAALQAMVEDVHAPQDLLTAEEWDAAEAVCRLVTHEVNRRAGYELGADGVYRKNP